MSRPRTETYDGDPSETRWSRFPVAVVAGWLVGTSGNHQRETIASVADCELTAARIRLQITWLERRRALRVSHAARFSPTRKASPR